MNYPKKEIYHADQPNQIRVSYIEYFATTY